MNRRLHTPIIACATIALALSAGLLFASPAALPDGTAAAAPVESERAPVRVERAQTEAAADAPRSRARRARSGLALPYFSFARGAGGRS